VVCSMQYSDICFEGLSEETQKPLITLANERPRFETRILLIQGSNIRID